MEILFLEQSPSNRFLLYHRKHSLQIGYSVPSQSNRQQSFMNRLSSTVKSDNVLSFPSHNH